VTYIHLLSTMYVGQGLSSCCKRENHIYLANRYFFHFMLMVEDPRVQPLSLISTVASSDAME
jgi:hypothetical protein